jgi:Tfp pilus assembly protein PilN
MTAFLVICAWAAGICIIVLAGRVIHLISVQKKLEWLLNRQRSALDRQKLDSDMLMETIADQAAEITRLKKLALDWEHFSIRVRNRLLSFVPETDIPILNLKTENHGSK